MEMINNLNEKMKELFKEFSTEEVYEVWADTFDVEAEDEKQVNIYYHGSKRIKEFKKQCNIALSSAVYCALGDGVKIKILKKKRYSSLSPVAKKNIRAVKFFVLGMIFVCIATAVIVVMTNYIGNRNFREIFYSTSSIKVDSRLRVIHLSDLHSVSYGKDNEKLINRIKALEPDVIICTGDMVDSTQDGLDYAVSLGEKLSQIAPSYYVYGNNEVESIYDVPLTEKELDEKFGFDGSNRDETALLKIEDTFEEKLESSGMKVLKNEKDTIQVKTMKVDVYGVLNSNPSSFWTYSGNAFTEYINEDSDNFKITAIHEPFIFEEFSPDFWGDLMVCGHTHGGVVRVPIIGPLYTHEGGLFPARKGAFVYGRYDVAGRPLIVSAGLENKNLFRLNNQPELVVIDVNKF